jgi:hypothetical protein|tara:strand:- start:804 stop:974 length:171 start_codon:yes stop_codon:yes gene_type:complete
MNEKTFLSQWKGSGIYDSHYYSFIHEAQTCPKILKGGTCWIGNKDTFIDIIEDIFA